MNEFTEKAMREAFRETLEEIEENHTLQNLFKTGVKNMLECEELQTTSLSDKLHYAMIIGYSFQNILQQQFLKALAKDELFKIRDGYEISSVDHKEIILVEKGKNFSNEQILEIAQKHLVSDIPNNSIIRKLSEIEIARYKKDVLENIGKEV